MTTVALKGQVGRDVAALFVEQLAGLSRSDTPVTLDMSEAEIEDAQVNAMLVNGIRNAALRTGAIQILRPPQVLAHCLYRVGLLGEPASIQLIEPRTEIATSS